MTTIAFGLNSVASDSRRCCGTERVDDVSQKIVVRDDAVYAVTGAYAFRDPAIAWYQAGADPDKIPKATQDLAWSLYVFDGSVLKRYAYDMPYPEEFPIPQAFGSGASYAQTALYLGLTAEEAVRTAAHFDMGTGGPIQSIDYLSVFGLKMAAE